MRRFLAKAAADHYRRDSGDHRFFHARLADYGVSVVGTSADWFALDHLAQLPTRQPDHIDLGFSGGDFHRFSESLGGG